MKLLSLLLFFSFSAFSQRGITQILATNQVINSSSGLIGPVKNIGQSSHQFFIKLKDNTGAGLQCTTPIGSVDYAINVVIAQQPIGTVTDGFTIPYKVLNTKVDNLVSNRASTVLVTDIIAPYVYLNFYAFTATQCLVDVAYSGNFSNITTVQSNTFPNAFTVLSEASNRIHTQTIAAGATVVLGGGSGLNVTPLYTRINVKSLRVTGSSTTANPVVYLELLERTSIPATVFTLPIPVNVNTMYESPGTPNWYTTRAGNQLWISNPSGSAVVVQVVYSLEL